MKPFYEQSGITLYCGDAREVLPTLADLRSDGKAIAARRPLRSHPMKSRNRKIAELTGLNFCDENCGCGENNRLWWFPSGVLPGYGAVPKWVPGWMNGADSDEIWNWLQENRKVLFGATP